MTHRKTHFDVVASTGRFTDCRVCQTRFEASNKLGPIPRHCSYACFAIDMEEQRRIHPATCLICKADFKAQYRRGRPQMYCSTGCCREAMRLQRTALKNIPKKCDQCSKDFFVNKWKTQQRFCSKQCTGAFNSKYGGSVHTNCSVCGNAVRRNPGKMRFEQVFCGYECMGKARRLEAPKSGKQAAVRKWFSRLNRMSSCEECGYDEVPGILVLHHKDRDRTNNVLTNLAILCPNCHALEHLKENKTGWNHVSTKKRKVFNAA